MKWTYVNWVVWFMIALWTGLYGDLLYAYIAGAVMTVLAAILELSRNPRGDDWSGGVK